MKSGQASGAQGDLEGPALSCFDCTTASMQAWDAVHVAGGLPQLAYARLDIARFRSIYATRGRWALLDQLASLPADCAAVTQAPAARALGTLGASPGAQGAARRAAVASLGALQEVVCRVAAAVLGPDAAEGTRYPAMNASKQAASVHSLARNTCY